MLRKALLLAAAGALYLSVAGFGPRPLETQELVDRVWRTCLNEGGLKNMRDCALIWQVVEGWADDTEGRIERLKKHSPRVNGLKPCDGIGNCSWTSLLGRDLSTPVEFRGQQEAYWRVKVAPRARQVLAYVEKLVDGSVRDRPCATKPSTWGGQMDHSGARSRGLYPLGCVGTLNDGFAPIGRLTIKARVAAGLTD